ncbi:hypothetical protein SDC9_156986 [bioreactor metagenome]|uniref:Uncharacterized protein n=1 Tax=bioreactor metagenome TaxID=1076179 RepID=A0A645FAW6_9ZZZZ
MAGMLCAGLEVLSCERYPEPYTAAWSYELHTPAGKCVCMWTLSQCMECTAGETVRRQWDGMEKSDASFADESMGAYRGKLDMTVTKIV